MKTKLNKLGARLRVSTWLIAAVLGCATASAAPLEKVTYNMAWLPQGSSIGIIVSQANGTFKKEGLDINIIRGYGGNRTANELDQGQYQFGYVDPVSLMLNRTNGGNIRLVGALNTRWPAGICFDKSRHNIKTLDDMKGLTMGGGSASAVQSVVPAWLEMNGKPKDFIHLLRMDPAVVDASLISGQIDLAECWLASNRAVMEKRAKLADVKLGWINYSDYGLDSYGSGIATREDLIKDKPEMIRKFLKGAYEGYAFAIKHPQKAADIMVKMFPTVDPNVALKQIKDMNDLIVDPTAKNKTLGYMRADRMTSTVTFVRKAFKVKPGVEAKDIYTNQFLK